MTLTTAKLSDAEGGYAAVETAFVQKSGGKLRYTWRLIKNLRANHKRSKGNN